MTNTQLVHLGIVSAAALAVAVCGGSTASTTPTTTAAGSIPAVYAKFGNGVQVSLDSQTVVLRTTDVPDHTSPYFGVGKTGYETPQAGMVVNPNLIAAQTIVLRVPVSHAVATAGDTPLGPTGIATNGVVLFNQYAAGRTPLTGEIFAFDRYNGHPSPSNQYHYHIEPL